jgi:hypothetical protein
MMDKFSGEELAVMLMEFLGTLENTPVSSILAALTTVAASIACEAGYDEDASVDVFRGCFQTAKEQHIARNKGLN